MKNVKQHACIRNCCLYWKNSWENTNNLYKYMTCVAFFRWWKDQCVSDQGGGGVFLKLQTGDCKIILEDKKDQKPDILYIRLERIRDIESEWLKIALGQIYITTNRLNFKNIVNQL